MLHAYWTCAWKSLMLKKYFLTKWQCFELRHFLKTALYKGGTKHHKPPQTTKTTPQTTINHQNHTTNHHKPPQSPNKSSQTSIKQIFRPKLRKKMLWAGVWGAERVWHCQVCHCQYSLIKFSLEFHMETEWARNIHEYNTCHFTVKLWS